MIVTKEELERFQKFMGYGKPKPKPKRKYKKRLTKKKAR